MNFDNATGSALFLPRPSSPRNSESLTNHHPSLYDNIVDEYGDVMNDVDEYSVLRPDIDLQSGTTTTTTVVPLKRCDSTTEQSSPQSQPPPTPPPRTTTRRTFSMSSPPYTRSGPSFSSAGRSRKLGGTGGSIFSRLFRSKKNRHEQPSVATSRTAGTEENSTPSISGRNSSTSRVFRTRSTPTRRSTTLSRKTRSRRFQFTRDRKKSPPQQQPQLDKNDSRAPTFIDRIDEKSMPGVGGGGGGGSGGGAGFNSMFSEISQVNDETAEPANLDHSPMRLNRSVNITPTYRDSRESGSLQNLAFTSTMQTLDIAPLSIVDTIQTIDIQPRARSSNPVRSQSMTIERCVVRPKDLDVQLKISRSEKVLGKVLRFEDSNDMNVRSSDRPVKSIVRKDSLKSALRSEERRGNHGNVSMLTVGNNERADSTLLDDKGGSNNAKPSMLADVSGTREDSTLDEEVCVPLAKKNGVPPIKPSLFRNGTSRKSNFQKKASSFEASYELSDTSLGEMCDVPLKRNSVLEKALMFEDSNSSLGDSMRAAPKDNTRRASLFESTFASNRSSCPEVEYSPVKKCFVELESPIAGNSTAGLDGRSGKIYSSDDDVEPSPLVKKIEFVPPRVEVATMVRKSNRTLELTDGGDIDISTAPEKSKAIVNESSSGSVQFSTENGKTIDTFEESERTDELPAIDQAKLSTTDTSVKEAIDSAEDTFVKTSDEAFVSKAFVSEGDAASGKVTVSTKGSSVKEVSAAANDASREYRTVSSKEAPVKDVTVSFETEPVKQLGVLARASMFEKPDETAPVVSLEKFGARKKSIELPAIPSMKRSDISGKTGIRMKAVTEVKLMSSRDPDTPEVTYEPAQISVTSKRTLSESVAFRALLSKFEDDDDRVVTPVRLPKLNVRALASRFENEDEAVRPPRARTWNVLAKPSVQIKLSADKVPQSSSPDDGMNETLDPKHLDDDKPTESEIVDVVATSLSEVGRECITSRSETFSADVVSGQSGTESKTSDKKLSVDEYLDGLQQEDSEKSEIEVREPSAIIAHSVLGKVSLFEGGEAQEVALPACKDANNEENPDESGAQANRCIADESDAASPNSSQKEDSDEDRSDPASPKFSLMGDENEAAHALTEVKNKLINDKNMSETRVENGGEEVSASEPKLSSIITEDEGVMLGYAEGYTETSRSGSIEGIDVDVVDESPETPVLSRSCSPVRREIFKPLSPALQTVEAHELVTLKLSPKTSRAPTRNSSSKSMTQGESGPPTVDIAKIINEYLSTASKSPSSPSARNQLPAPKGSKPSKRRFLSITTPRRTMSYAGTIHRPQPVQLSELLDRSIESRDESHQGKHIDIVDDSSPLHVAKPASKQGIEALELQASSPNFSEAEDVDNEVLASKRVSVNSIGRGTESVSKQFAAVAPDNDNEDDIIGAPSFTTTRHRRAVDEIELQSTSPALLNGDLGFRSASPQGMAWRCDSSHGNLTSPLAPNGCPLPANYQAESSPDDDGMSAMSSDTSFENPSTGIVQHVITGLARAHSLLDNRSVRRAHMCNDFDLIYSERSAPGWECGHLCAASMISSLFRDESLREKLSESGISKNPSIRDVARRIEQAWSGGFDVDGASKYSGTLVGRRAYLGATEVAVLLISSGIPACTRAFPARTPRERRLFFDWVLTHFERCCGNSNGCALHQQRRQRDCSAESVIVPLFVSWPMRACLVVGAERVRNGNVRLLVIEPTAACAHVLTARSVKKRVAVARRGESHPQWASSQQYHVVYVDQVMKNEMKLNNRFGGRRAQSFSGFSVKRVSFGSGKGDDRGR